MKTVLGREAHVDFPTPPQTIVCADVSFLSFTGNFRERKAFSEMEKRRMQRCVFNYCNEVGCAKKKKKKRLLAALLVKFGEQFSQSGEGLMHRAIKEQTSLDIE